jgi:large subunit ribosomal protein L13
MQLKKQKTTRTTKQDTERGWVIVDLKDKPLGRAASTIAKILRGKNKATYEPHIDNGDFVVAINSSKIKLTGKKWDLKLSRSHSGYPGGLKEWPANKVMERHPDKLIRDAVWGMMPKNTSLSKRLMTKFKVYANAEHPHASQNPQKVEI